MYAEIVSASISFGKRFTARSLLVDDGLVLGNLADMWVKKATGVHSRIKKS